MGLDNKPADLLYPSSSGDECPLSIHGSCTVQSDKLSQVEQRPAMLERAVATGIVGAQQED